MNKGNTNCVICGRKCLSLLEGLSDGELSLLEEKRVIVSYRAGETIYKEGLTPIGLLCLNIGKAKIIVSRNTDKKEVIVELKKPVDFIGFTELMNDCRYQTTAVAMEDSSVCVIDRDDFFKVLKDNSDFSLRVMKLLANELTKSQWKTLSLSQKKQEARLAESLLWLSEIYCIDNNDGYIPLKRDDFAAMSGLTPTSISRTLSLFKKDGILLMNGRKIKITDKKKLEEISSS